RSPVVDPCAPEGLALPDGDDDVVVTGDGAQLALRPPASTVRRSWCSSTAGSGARNCGAGGPAPRARRVPGGALRPAGPRCLVVGKGLSDIGRLGDDLAAVLAHLGARDAVVVGHSMGGMSIQAYVGRH